MLFWLLADDALLLAITAAGPDDVELFIFTMLLLPLFFFFNCGHPFLPINELLDLFFVELSLKNV